MAPGWLTVIAWLYPSVCFCCAGIIAYDITVNCRRQPMGVMNFVFPITALYFGPFALALYWRWGRGGHPQSLHPADAATGRWRCDREMRWSWQSAAPRSCGYSG